MKVYCQFLQLSTGYVANTIPPQFSEDNKKPIDILGSDGRFILDGRKSLSTLMHDCHSMRLKKRNLPIGFKIIRANSYREDGVVVHEELCL
jgi:hypothetical protein